MSAGHGHTRPNEKHPVELHKFEADPDFQRMWNRPFRVVTTFQIPDSCGYSVMADQYFCDSDLYRAVMAGTWTHPKTGRVYVIKVPGLTPQDILECLMVHERTEKSLLDADNKVNDYLDAHEFATLAEHTKVKAKGGRPVDYERALAPLIAWNQVKPLTHVPPNLSCAPVIDDPDAQDKITIKVLQKLGVRDAFKIAKKTVDYSLSSGTDKCSGCANWASPNRTAELSPCKVVDGAVRTNFWCTKYEGMQDGQELDQGSNQAQGSPPPGPGGSAGGENPSQEAGGGIPLQQPNSPQASQPSQNPQGDALGKSHKELLDRISELMESAKNPPPVHVHVTIPHRKTKKKITTRRNDKGDMEAHVEETDEE